MIYLCYLENDSTKRFISKGISEVAGGESTCPSIFSGCSASHAGGSYFFKSSFRFANAHFISDPARTAITSLILHRESGRSHFLFVHHDVPVGDELARGEPRWREAEPVDHVVQAAFQKFQHLRAGSAFRRDRHAEEPLQIPLVHAVGQFELSFLADLQAEFRKRPLARRAARARPACTASA